MAKNNKTRFFYVLYSDKTRVFDQSERAYYLIYIINARRRSVHSKEFHVEKRKRLTLARTFSILFSTFPYIYVMLSLNFEFAEETLQTDVWTIGTFYVQTFITHNPRILLHKAHL